MKFKLLRLSLFFVAFAATFIACNEDDDQNITVELRDRTEQQIADSDSLIDYLSSHYYNSGFFETGTNHKYTDIVITELGEGEDVPDGHTLLIDAVGNPLTTTYEDTAYEYYVLRLNDGGGESPNFTDQVRVRYEGFLEETGDVFDVVTTPIDLRMQQSLGLGAGGVIRGWQLILSDFNTALDFTTNNGLVEFNDYGLGVMFLPSGLGYFGIPVSGVPSYSNLIFKFELLQFQVEDHDDDGIPTYVEDIDNSIDVIDDDTDGDQLPNYLDPDDDADGVFTRDELQPTTYIVDTNMGETEPMLGDNEYELSRSESSGIITINTVTLVDTNNNGIFDHLDEDVTTNYNEDDDE